MTPFQSLEFSLDGTLLEFGCFRQLLRQRRTLLGDEDEAKDVMQEVFMKALSEHPRFEVSAQTAS